MVSRSLWANELRYWDGGQWTQHVSSLGRQGIDPPVVGSPVLMLSRAGKKIQRDVRRAGVDAGAQPGGGTLFTEPVLVVNQKAKLIEINAEYAVYDQHGRQIGAVREVGRSMMKNSCRWYRTGTGRTDCRSSTGTARC